MKSRLYLAIVAALALGTTAAIAQTSQKSGDTYDYAPTVLGWKTPQAYAVEPNASAAVGAESDARLNPIVEALNADASLKGSKLTVVPEGEVIYLTGVTVKRDQMKRAMEIATSHAGEGKAANAIQTEELVVVQDPAAEGTRTATAPADPNAAAATTAPADPNAAATPAAPTGSAAL